LKFVAHGAPVQKLALRLGWWPGARYTNLRDIRGLRFKGVGFLDIDWRNYDFSLHLKAANKTRPLLTVARDVIAIRDLDSILREADELRRYARYVVIVPKDPRLAKRLDRAIPEDFLLGYSVPTKYGATRISPECFRRPVHLLGGRPDVQRRLADFMPVVSLDCNRFTLDAQFGDYFDGSAFRPHPTGGYAACLRDSMRNIDVLWRDYRPVMNLSSTLDERS
jgi:hypothetical protein